MNSFVRYGSLPVGLIVASALVVGCSSVDEKASAKPAATAASAPAAAKAETTKASKTKAVEVQGVISAVGQRTITFQMERKGKVREEVVGVDDKTKIEKGGANVKLRDLETSDLALINYVPEAYTPAIAIKVTGKGQLKKTGGDD
jgi:hypothetical protein